MTPMLEFVWVVIGVVMAASTLSVSVDAGGRIPVVVIVPGHPSGVAYCEAGQACDAVPDLRSHAKRNALLIAGMFVLAVGGAGIYAMKKHIDSRD
jgi:hypothetical protein